ARTYGWKLHEVTLKGPDEPKIIMGIVVGETLDVPRDYYAHIVTDIDGLRGRTVATEGFLAHIKGHISYVNQVTPDRANRLRSLLHRALSRASRSRCDSHPRTAVRSP
ncbi:unnamed protein product, partial [marine sediment metagenome]